jgi:uncharacterized repeat protein (TIGR01451 family)
MRYILLSLLMLCGTQAAAQELLLNRSFESPAVPANGNNFYVTIPNWTIANVTPAQGSPWNIIRPWSGYAGNPTVTPTGGGIQYADVNSASGTMIQTVTIPSTGMVDISGWFSVRDNQQALSGLSIRVVNSSNVTIATISTSFLASDPIGLWKQAQLANIPVTAGTYTFQVDLPNPANFDLASMVFKPGLTLTKTSTAYSDPLNNLTDPKLIPGGVAEYTITATNPGGYIVTSNSIAVTDATPAGLDLVVADIGVAGSGPGALVPGSSGLGYSFISLANAGDSIEFSNDGGATYTYTPTISANGTDPAVTHVRIRPTGTMAANSNFAIRLRYRVE